MWLLMNKKQLNKKQLQEKIEEIIYKNFHPLPKVHIDLTKAAEEIIALFESE